MACAELVPDKNDPKAYRVEAIDADGGCEVALFSGPHALDRAIAFAGGGEYYEQWADRFGLSEPGALPAAAPTVAVVPGTPDVHDHTCVLLCQLDIVAGKATVRVAPGYRVMYEGDHYSIRYKAP